MPLRKLLLATALICVSLHAQKLPPAVTADPPQDKAKPATTDSFQLPSHGEKLNAFVYIAAGAGPHPVVVLLHGFPGNEKNLDIAQAIRRAGWDVLFFNYRGSWGSPGSFSFTHAMEDTVAALAYLRDPANAKRLRLNPKDIVLIGHSMGGMIAANIGAHDPEIHAIGLISAADMAGRLLPALKSRPIEAVVATAAERLVTLGVAPLAGCTPESLAQDLIANAVPWSIPTQASGLAVRPILIVTSDDGLAPASDALAINLRALKDTHVTALHLATDHVYSDQRIALTTTILNWLDTLPRM